MLTDNFSELENLRLAKLEQLRLDGIEPYPTRSFKNSNNADAIKAFEAREAVGETEALKLTLAGRLRAIRNMGKLSFAHIEDRSGRIQLFMRINELGQEKLDQFVRYFDLGDFIEATGTMVRTKRGEVTLQVEDFRILSKALYQLPAAKDEVVDGEVIRHAALTEAGLPLPTVMTLHRELVAQGMLPSHASPRSHAELLGRLAAQGRPHRGQEHLQETPCC